MDKEVTNHGKSFTPLHVTGQCVHASLFGSV
jgi:hypothetical protein